MWALLRWLRGSCCRSRIDLEAGHPHAAPGAQGFQLFTGCARNLTARYRQADDYS